jgi:hypothetical protein
MNHLSEEQLVLHYYAESGDEASIESHLSSCDSCRNVYRELQQALALVSSAAAPERPAEYGSFVWRRVQPHLRPVRRLGWAFLQPQRWAWTTAIAALVVAAFLMGRYWPRAEPRVEQLSVTAEVGKRILLSSAADHLERSQMVLMDLAHFREKGEVDISADQTRARELLASNRIYRQTAQREGEPALAALLDDLERTLLEIAHSPAKVNYLELSQLQKQMESDGILFKLRVTGSRMRERQNAAARELSQRST